MGPDDLDELFDDMEDAAEERRLRELGLLEDEIDDSWLYEDEE